jgi:hypothetical protein
MRVFGRAPHVSFFTAGELEGEMAESGFGVVESARHGTGRRDARIFIVGRR